MGRQGVRAEWSVIPAPFRAEIDRTLGSAVVEATNLPGGFSPGPAARCRLADGRLVFVKAGGPELNPDTPRFHRREARVLQRLPADHPSPTLLAVVDDDEWIAIVTEWIPGHSPTPPLDDGEIRRILHLLDRHAASGRDVDPYGIEDFATVGRPLFGHWRLLAADPPTGLDPWSRAHAERLAAVEADAGDAGAGSSLIHLDFRADNVLLSDRGPDHDVVVDWPSGAIGAPWIDLVCLVASLHLDGGPPPREVVAMHRLGHEADPEALDRVLAAFTGFLTRLALQPSPPGLPTVRAFQAAQAAVLRPWLAQRLRLPDAPR